MITPNGTPIARLSQGAQLCLSLLMDCHYHTKIALDSMAGGDSTAAIEELRTAGVKLREQKKAMMVYQPALNDWSMEKVLRFKAQPFEEKVAEPAGVQGEI